MDNNNTVVYHLFCTNDGLDRFHKTYEKIKQSNLLNNIDLIHVNCVGPHRDEWGDKISSLEKVKVYKLAYQKSERATVNLTKRLASKNPSGNTLYLHSKGASNKWSNNESGEPKDLFTVDDYIRQQRKECIDAWIDFMEYHLIEKYQKCLDILKHCHTCGCNKDQTDGRMFQLGRWRSWHYSGNFWWARNEYLNLIPPAQTDHYTWPETIFINGINANIGHHKEIARTEFDWPLILVRKLNPDSYRQ